MSNNIYRLCFAVGCIIFGHFNGFSQIIINEIHYNPDVKTEPVEFVELFNKGTNPVSLAGWYFSDGIQFTFPQGAVINGRGYVVVAQNPTALKNKFGYASAFGPYMGGLSKYGDKITLRDPSGNIVDEVEYKCGFPWPIVGDPPGYSIELIHPDLDNDLGSNWRPSVASGTYQSHQVVLIQTNSVWKYYKGTNEPSAVIGEWRKLNFDDSGWLEGAMPIGYDPAVPMGTYLSDMASNYTCVYFRKTFTVDDVYSISSLYIDVMLDDGIKVWINGYNVLNGNISTNELPYTGTALVERESTAFIRTTISSPSLILVPGVNVIAIQGANASKESTDFYINLKLTANIGVSASGPTPGAINAAYSTNAAPAIRQVEHKPEQPTSGTPVLITAKVTDPDGVKSVVLEYQIVEPGNYIDILDAAYTNSANWIKIPMNDEGRDGDSKAYDNIYSVTIPASVQQHRRLIRYRITVTDNVGFSARVPYPDDPQPNFAYFVYDGVPSWRGAIQPGAAGTNGTIVTIPADEMGRLPVFHLISKKSHVEYATGWRLAGASGGISNRYTGDLYFWPGTLVYDGKVYDHIHFRARGGVWRYSMVKNMWKIDMNRGHDFEARDNWGRKIKTPWNKVNLGACIQQGDYDHRGEQGMFESVGFRLFQLAGVPTPDTAFVTLRIIDEPEEASPTTQYEGDFWGLYLLVEQENGRFLEEHGLPDSNFYKMEGGTGTLNNIGPNGPLDKSDLNYILNNYTGASDAWWRTNWDLYEYYSYQSIVQAIHHYDISGNKNYFYYYHPQKRLWMITPWDLDLTWAHNMYLSTGGGIDNIASRLFNATAVAGTGSQAGTSNMQLGGTRPKIEMEFKNRVREIRELLFNRDQAWKLIDEYAMLLRGPTNRPSIVDADRMMWDYNPKMADGNYTPNLNKAGQGRFYQFPRESSTNTALKGSFDATIRIMKNYVDIRGEYLDSLCYDPLIPNRPQISYLGPEGYPINKLVFRTSSFSTPSQTNTFGYLKWRIAEITDTNSPTFRTNEPFKYEIEAVWESGIITNFTSDIIIPPEVVRTGNRYRVRVLHADNWGRESMWSLPVEFVVGQPDNAALLKQYLRITEIMYNPPAGGYEYIELKNISSDTTLDLAGVKFTQGIEFTFGSGISLAPGEYIVVANAPPDNNFAAFRQYYGIDNSVKIVGPFTNGKLDNAGEQLVLRTAAGGSDIVNFQYNNSRGWPVTPDATGHSLVYNELYLYDQNTAASQYGGNWMASAYIKGSPGSADPILPQPQVLINEIIIDSAPDDPNGSNNYIELYNPTDIPVVLGSGWYLSDNPSLLNKWAIPSGTTVPAKGFIAFNQLTDFGINKGGFNLSSKGGIVYLSYITSSREDRVVDVARFKALETGKSWGRYPDGATYWATLSKSSPAQNNAQPLKTLKISEIYYHPPEFPDGSDNTVDEFIEIYNPLDTVVRMTNGWRLDGGVSFYFPVDLVIQPKSYILVVNFDPSDSGKLELFKSKMGISNSDAVILGPYQGKLANDSERVALEYVAAGDLTGTAFVIADEVIYADRSPWPCGADGSGNSIQRVSMDGHGSDPYNWDAQLPTPFAQRLPLPAGLPQIMRHPESKIVPTNANVTFSVSLCGAPPFTYQWRFNGNNLYGETNSTLTLYNVRLADAGEYSVVVGNSAGMITSAVARLIVQLPPYIIQQPQSLNATGYTTVMFSVLAGGTEPLYYQWLYQNYPIPNATNSILVLTNVNKTNEGNYSVIVYNTAGSVQSDTVTLSLKMPPHIEIQPKSATIRDGLTNIFTTLASGEPPLYYQWYFNGVLMPGETSTNLAIKSAWETNDGDYFVVVTNLYGSATSEVAHLTVLVRPYIKEQPTPSLAVVPVGSDVSFTIVAGGTLPISYRWRKGGTTITNIVLDSYVCTFTLRNVQVSDSGNYNCAMTNIAGSATRLSSNATLTVLYPPAITNQPSSVISAIGSDATFKVGASGGAPLSYQWWFNVTNLISGATNSTLSVSNIQQSNLGLYSVVVSNPVGVVTSQFASLNIEGAPVILIQPSNIVANTGETVIFKVIATNNNLSYQWLFNNVPIAGAVGSQYQISKVSVGNQGSYRVIVANEFGAVISDEATLTVNENAPFRIARIYIEDNKVIIECETFRNSEFVLEESVNLNSWTPTQTNTAVNGVLKFIDNNFNGNTKKFYRITLQ